MRVFVKVCCAGSVAGQTYTIPCNDPAASVGYLKAQALDRWGENNGKKSKGGEERKAEEFQLKFSGNGALLSDKDVIRDVLRDGEFVNLCKRVAVCVKLYNDIIVTLTVVRGLCDATVVIGEIVSPGVSTFYCHPFMQAPLVCRTQRQRPTATLDSLPTPLQPVRLSLALNTRR
jgi:hypothetical protein